MQLIEIRLGTGLLIVGTPLAIDPVMLRADDPFMRGEVLRKLHSDRYAMARVRTLYPMLAAQNLDPWELVVRLVNDLRTGRLQAVYIRESSGDVEPLELPMVRASVVHIELPGVTVLLASRGMMPAQFKNAGSERKGSDEGQGTGALGGGLLKGLASPAVQKLIADAVAKSGKGALGGDLLKGLQSPQVQKLIGDAMKKSGSGMAGGGLLDGLQNPQVQKLIANAMKQAGQGALGGDLLKGLQNPQAQKFIADKLKHAQKGALGGDLLGFVNNPDTRKAVTEAMQGARKGMLGGNLIGTATDPAVQKAVSKMINRGGDASSADKASRDAAMRIIAALDPEGAAMRMLQRQVDRLSFGIDSRADGDDLKRALLNHLTSGQIEAVVLTSPGDIAMARARRETPVPVETMGPGQRVAEALLRSRRYLDDEILSVVEEMVRPDNLTVMAALLFLAAVAQTNPITAALVDSTLVMIAWISGGMAAVTALGLVFTATLEAADADSEEAIEEAARQYAKALTMLGASVLQALMARSFSRKGGTQGTSDADFAQKLNDAARQTERAAAPPVPASGRSTRSQAAGGQAAARPTKAQGVVEKEPGKFEVQTPGQKGAWNKALNQKLKPNSEYKYNGYTYKTDANGNVVSVEGKLTLKTADRNTYQQAKTGHEGNPGDEGGHLIASIFNGPGEKINMAPMDGNLNKGAWKKLENSWADSLKDGKAVDVKIDVVRSGDAARPDRFVVNYQVAGDRPKTSTFDNVPGG